MACPRSLDEPGKAVGHERDLLEIPQNGGLDVLSLCSHSFDLGGYYPPSLHSQHMGSLPLWTFLAWYRIYIGSSSLFHACHQDVTTYRVVEMNFRGFVRARLMDLSSPLFVDASTSTNQKTIEGAAQFYDAVQERVHELKLSETS
ncbi:hypothetical protein OPV22_002785 [Ensete ventricosum]|uniref:Uncharacterized protein n=1 Tax=Ensete ventricosum TaxID=4639 RepID=A0AAV8RZ00_ENSVE|nr:hypothetical protein OPV22_002785 [Ensete ventricosum]